MMSNISLTIIVVFCTTSDIKPDSVFKFTITVNIISTKYEVEKFNCNNNFSLWQRKMKNILIQQAIYKTLFWEKRRNLRRWTMMSWKRWFTTKKLLISSQQIWPLMMLFWLLLLNSGQIWPLIVRR